MPIIPRAILSVCLSVSVCVCVPRSVCTCSQRLQELRDLTVIRPSMVAVAAAADVNDALRCSERSVQVQQ